MRLAATPATMGADGTSTSSIVASAVDSLGNPVAAPSPIVVSLTDSNTGSCTLTGGTTTIPAASTDSSLSPGVVTATTTAGACSIGGNATGGFTGAASAVTITTHALGGITLPAEVLAPPGGSVSFTVTLTTAAPAGGATVNLSTNNLAVASVSPASLLIPVGKTSGTATLTGVAAGSTSIAAASTNYSSTSTLATVEVVTVSFVDLGSNPISSIYWGLGTTRQAEAKLSAAAPQGGLTLTLTSQNLNFATVTPSVFVPGGQLTSGAFTVTGVGQGTTTMTAANASVSTGTLTLQVGPAPALTLSDNNGYLAAGMHRNFAVYLNYAAPTGGQPVSLSGFNPSIDNLPVTSVTVPAGQTSVYFEVDGIAAGAGSVTAAATGWTTGTTNFTVQNPILAISGPGTPVTTLTATDNFTIYAYAPNCAYCDAVTATAGETISFTVSSIPGGIIAAPAPMTMAHQNYYASGQMGQASATGTYTLTATATLPGSPSVTSNTVTVNQPGLSLSDNGGYLAAGMHRNFAVYLTNPAPTGGLPVRISGFNTATANVPAPSFTVPAGGTSATFEVDGIAAGATSVTANAGGWASGTSNFTVQNPVLAISGPSSPVTTLTASDAFTIYAYAPNCAYCDTITAASGEGIGFSVASTPGGIIAAPGNLTMTQGTYYISGQMGQASAGGTYTLTATALTLPGGASVTSNVVTVNQPGLSVSDNGGYLAAGMHRNFAVYLTNPAPTGGLPVTITGFNTATANVPAPSFTVTAGQTSASFEVDGIAAGTTSVTANATSWSSGTSNFTVQNPVLAISGPGTPVTTLTATDNFTLYAYAPSCAYCDTITAASGESIGFSVASTPTGIIATPANLAMPQGTYYVSGQMGQATAGGTYTLTATALTLPGGASVTSSLVTVNQPTITVSDHNGYLGAGMHRNFSVSLSNPAPANGLVVSIASTDPTIAAVTAPTVTVPAGQTSAAFEVDGLSAATTSITASAGAWTGDSANITVENPVLALSGPRTPVTTATASDSFTVYIYAPHCAYCDVVSAAAGVTLGFTVNTATAGIVPTPASIAIPGGAYYVTSQVGQATATGTYTLTATGASAPGSPSTTSATVTVTAPYLAVSDNNQYVGAGMHRNFSVSLSDPAPAGGLPVTISGFNTATANVPGPSFTVAAGNSSAQFEVDGIAAGTTLVTASSSGWTPATSNFAVENPVLVFSGPATAITTSTPSDAFTVYLYAPHCAYCDVATANVTLNATINTATPGIVATPGPLTIPAGSYYVNGSLGQPTTTGTFTLTETATGVPGSPSVTSAVITVS